ncbi:MAG: Segregation and condensation protein ScpA [Chloroflexi bacterium]|nr:Segregation and condensation protein ScpA [Chloroflexota bacterium]
MSQLVLADVMSWVLGRARTETTSVGEVCGILESAARLLLLKARRLSGMWEVQDEAESPPWLGPPEELPERRSWLTQRLASGPLSFLSGSRDELESMPSLAPILPGQLQTAMLSVLGRARPTLALLPPRISRVSVEACSSLILERLAGDDEFHLAEIAGYSRDASVAAFLACLILARQGHIELIQNELFGDIVVRQAARELVATA